MSDQNGRRIMEFPRVETVNPNAVMLIDGDEHGTSSIRLSTLLSYIQNGIEFPEQTPEFNLGDLTRVPYSAVTDSAELLIQPDTGSQAAITIKNFLDGICNSELQIPVASKEYVTTKIAELINGAPETLDTLKELGDAITENKDVLEALNTLTNNFGNRLVEMETSMASMGEDILQNRENCDLNIMDDVDQEFSPINDSDKMILGQDIIPNDDGSTGYVNQRVSIGELKKIFGSGGVSDGVDFTNLTEAETIGETDALLLGTGDPVENKKVTIPKFTEYINDHLDISKLPKGTKAITKEFTVSGNAYEHTAICNISDFGIDDINDVISFYCFCFDNNFTVYYGLIRTGDITCNYYTQAPFTNFTFSVTLVVKDYSEIGSEIVTQNVKMLTKEVTLTTSNGMSSLPVGNISDFEIDNVTDVVASMITQISGSDFGLGGLYISQSTGNIAAPVRDSFGGSITGTFNVSLFVKVPVVEQLPRFTKDVEGTFSNTAWTTLLTLDGSDNVGGFTKDNIKSISCSLYPINGVNLALSPPIIQNDGKVQTLLLGSGNYPGKVRITIE